MIENGNFETVLIFSQVQSVILLLGGSDVTDGVNMEAIPQKHRVRSLFLMNFIFIVLVVKVFARAM